MKNHERGKIRKTYDVCDEICVCKTVFLGATGCSVHSFSE